tara:strand:+ start:362 stop:865 length:504 start_codon:yes stop_codon:yes gene_type:complete
MKILLVLLTLFTSFSAYAHDFALYPEPMRSPVSLFEDQNGSIKTLGSFQGKVTVVNFWATWCKPCIVEMPSLAMLQRKFGKAKVAVVPVIRSSEKVSTVRSFYRRYKLRELEYYIDTNDLTAQSFQVDSIPMSFIFNKQGEVVASVNGSINWMDKSNVQFIQDLLDQ